MPGLMSLEFDVLLEAAPDAMLITDSDGTVVRVNSQAEKLLGIARADLCGQPIERIVPQRFQGSHPALRRGYAAAPRPRPMGAGVELHCLRGDGTEFPAEISLSPLVTEGGTRFIAAIRDVTSRKIAEEERAKLDRAQEAIRMRDEFLSIAAHELNTPLTALHLQVDGMLRSARLGRAPPRPEQMLGKLDTIHEALQRLTALVAQLLDVSRITSGRLTLARQEVDLAPLVRGVLDRFRPAQAKQEIRFQAPDAPVVGWWDGRRLEQVVSNLVSNALKYGLDRPIDILVSSDQESGIVSIRDQGIGIAPEDQARIFERFEPIAAGRQQGGFGVGLWMARWVAEAHGGTVVVQSELGAGSTFTVTLPREMPSPGRGPG